MKIFYCCVFIALIAISIGSKAQVFCDSSGGNIAIFSNYDAGILRINVDMNIPNLKIGIVSYENDSIIITGPYVSNISKVIYACYFVSNNLHCAPYPKLKTITGAPPGTDTIIYMPPATSNNTNGWPDIICNYTCDVNSNQGGCNTADQIADYFFNAFGSTAFLFHKTQYGCWTGTQNLSDGGNCCAVAGAIPPTVNFSASKQSICQNDCIGFVDNSTNLPTKWNWSFPGATPASSTLKNPPFICYTSAGTYDVKLVVENSAGADSVTFNNYVDVLASPLAPTITQSSDSLICSIDPSYISYQWYLGSTAIPGATNYYYVVSQNGNYNVEVMNINNCRVAGGINVSVGIGALHSNNFNVSVFSISNETKLQIKALYGSLNKVGTLKIYNLLGKICYQSAISPGVNGDAVIDISDFLMGVYFVEIATENIRQMEKFVKK